ncbi:MAG: Mrp/NBP35 family ATP-binding protein [Canibacter sp.]
MTHTPDNDTNPDPRITAIWRALARVNDPEIRQPITDLGMVQEVRIASDDVPEVDLLLTISGCPAAQHIEDSAHAAALTAPRVDQARINVGVMTPEQRKEFIQQVRGDRTHEVQFGPDSLTRVIAVTSGKGGVGKSSLTASLATAFAAKGRKVGLIDADVFGFSIPGIMGLTHDGVAQTPTKINDLILPPIAYDVQVISIGMFLGDADPRKTAVSWRGPMLHRTIEQFLRDVWFGDLDVLFLDLPPGTGDIAISVGQLLPQAEVLVVTTPQEAAADVAVRSAVLARQSGQRVVGVVENMSSFYAPDGSLVELFGSGGGQLVASRLTDDEHGEVPLLGSVPLSSQFREAGDLGKPAVLTHPNDPAAQEVQRIADELDRQGRGLQGRRLPVSL